MKIGVLALQGAFIEHINMINKINQQNCPSLLFNQSNNFAFSNFKLQIECVEIRRPEDLAEIDAIIIPGGESTVQGLLLRKSGLFNSIKKLIESGMPVLATCAGLILLAKEIKNESSAHLQTFPIKVVRNAYGRQLGSFCSTANVGEIKDFPLVFIRAPYIKECLSPDVTVLCKDKDRIVAAQYKNQFVYAFHPEMSDNTRIHEEFIKAVFKYSSKKLLAG